MFAVGFCYKYCVMAKNVSSFIFALSIFASVEVKKFKPPKVKNLNVVLFIQKNSVTNCTNESLENLTMGLDKGIGYRCVEVPDSHLKECGSDPEKPCGACW
ncbi:hypothetical protein ILYODFUR_008902 [Ilyodon furcidens]|uniref:ADP-ribosyl cyclase/cyclic ADP-ribose hydrolase n=1 Tax=Ilyodon furcidens TaxID=33524 RepID=A0ABV0UFH4_9TELE